MSKPVILITGANRGSVSPPSKNMICWRRKDRSRLRECLLRKRVHSHSSCSWSLKTPPREWYNSSQVRCTR